MKKTILIFASILSLGVGSIATFSNSSNLAFADAKSQIQSGVNDAGGSDNSTDAKVLIKNVINFMLFLIGVLAVIMIIYGGIQYVISVGDAGKVSKAKNTIIYAVVGLVVAVMSYAIVNFVLGSLDTSKKAASETSATIININNID